MTPERGSISILQGVIKINAVLSSNLDGDIRRAALPFQVKLTDLQLKDMKGKPLRDLTNLLRARIEVRLENKRITGTLM